MANRYRNQNYGRGYENRGGSGNRWSQSGRGGYGSDLGYDRERYGSSSYGGYSQDYAREEDYYGGRQYREGYRGSGAGRDYIDEDDYTTGPYQGNRGSGGSEYERENYYGGSGSMNEYGGGGTYGPYTERRRYGRGYRNYSGNYPESESGYDYERSDDERGWLDKASDEVSSWLGDEEAARRRRLDARRQGGSHRGRGPRNYTRSDERIREDINDRLTDSDYLDASDIEVAVTSGDVILNGTVENRYAKRLAEDIAEDVSGVKNVENRLRVNQSFYGQRGSSLTNTPEETGMAGTGGASGATSTGLSSAGTTAAGNLTDTPPSTTTGKSRSKTA